ncbi:MAG TPA: hypothetical protein HA298_06925 [Methanobacteriales archaeon]|nr:MAG: Uncharacterized protein XD44_0639 [Methanobacteriaceae archaeon 41_258]HIH62391.1 hypothetical protein [Methanobacteriales archaeon]
MKGKIIKFLGIFIIFNILMGTSAATLNVIVVTDPSGQDPNGFAGGSMSFAQNMFQSTFILSKEHHFTILSGGEGEAIPRLMAIVDAINILKNGGTAKEAASAASGYPGIRIMCGGPDKGAAVGGSFDAYVVIVEDDGTITVTPYSGGLAVLPPGKKGAIIHLRNTHGNPKYGTASAVRKEVAIKIGKMIRDGYPATVIVSEVFKDVAENAGEKYGGGAVNVASGVSTGDMFTPANLNETGYPMDQPYAKVCPHCGWSAGYPTAENYKVCPLDGTPLKTIYAYDALRDAITVTEGTVSVSVYGSDEAGVIQTTQEIVKATVKEKGYSEEAIAKEINDAIDNGLIIGVNYVEPKDINVKPGSKAVGVYYTPLPDHRTAPPMDLPISSSFFEILGDIQTALGCVLLILLLFRSTLISSFMR